MKKKKLIPVLISLMILGTSFSRVVAQEKVSEEKQKQQQMQEAIDAQKKEMIEQKRSQEEFEKALQEQRVTMDEALKTARENMENAQEFNKVFRIYDGNRGSRSYTGEPFVFSPGSDFYFGRPGEDETDRTTWDFSKSIKELTFSREYVFDVESTVKSVIMSVNGDCKAGDIRIKILMPNGKVYSDIVIDEFGNLNWRKSFNITETENKDKTGPWKFEINSSKATGYFKISLQTY
jgi:hypothetical protein